MTRSSEGRTTRRVAGWCGREGNGRGGGVSSLTILEQRARRSGDEADCSRQLRARFEMWDALRSPRRRATGRWVDNASSTASPAVSIRARPPWPVRIASIGVSQCLETTATTVSIVGRPTCAGPGCSGSSLFLSSMSARTRATIALAAEDEPADEIAPGVVIEPLPAPTNSR